MIDDVELLGSIAGNVLLFALVWGMSASVQIENMKEQLQNRNALLVGVLCQFLLLPILGFAIVRVLEPEHTIGISLLVVTSSPGGSYSNWYAFFCLQRLPASSLLTYSFPFSFVSSSCKGGVPFLMPTSRLALP